ncbi:primase-helicase family protein [Sulfurospirillum multivorans]|uniref:NrS-1 polymerase-like helicase domain-containing protein n=2 Tax=Sulfurospirillum multivorans TaxID=66821 RepID=A0AA86E128_SULMK|nr:primase-helicase family protein [Sulfurospirillum multivorans]AHJ11322.1 hypothetical protein SMUL_0034 [Sulfurospirillum multivorans DSM 12446]QEH04826.1 hypothetical protein SMN_0032 [Sulfurospirillum multivorans]
MNNSQLHDLNKSLKYLTKDQIFKVIDSLRELDLIANEVHLEEILKSGQISENIFLFKDEKEGYIIERDGQIDNLSENAVKSYLVQKYNYFNLAFLSSRMLVIPMLKKIFNPLEISKIYNEGEIKYFNTFLPSPYVKASLSVETRHDLDIEFVKREYNYIYTLLENLFKKDEYIEYFLNWISCVVNTRQKIGTCLIIRGTQGAGKNFLLDHILKPLVGEDYAIEQDNDRLNSKFNSHLIESLIVCWNEIKGDFRDSSTTADKMKSLITESKIVLEKKGQDVDTKTHTYFNSIIFSNHSLPFQIDIDDRRFTVIETNSINLSDYVQKKHDIKYSEFESFIEKFDSQVSSFLNYIVSLKYSISKARKSLDTESKRGIAEASSSQLTKLKHKLKARTPESIQWIFNTFCEMFVASEDINKTQFDITLKRFLKEVCIGKVSIASLTFAYKFYVNQDAINSKIQKDLQVEFGETKRNSSVGYKYLGEEIECNLESLFAEEEELNNPLEDREFDKVIDKIYNGK